MPVRHIRAFGRLINSGGRLCRQFSSSEEARDRGKQYLYFTIADNRKFPTGSGAFFVEKEIVKPCADGLFEETPQSFEAVSAEEFEQFKARYEEMPVR